MMNNLLGNLDNMMSSPVDLHSDEKEEDDDETEILNYGGSNNNSSNAIIDYTKDDSVENTSDGNDYKTAKVLHMLGDYKAAPPKARKVLVRISFITYCIFMIHIYIYIYIA